MFCQSKQWQPHIGKLRQLGGKALWPFGGTVRRVMHLENAA